MKGIVSKEKVDRAKLHPAWEGFPFEILGHFEEMIDVETHLCIGTRPVDYLMGPSDKRKGVEVPPVYGYYGSRLHTFKKGETITVDKAHKGMQPLKFKKDTTVTIMTQPTCGRIIPRHIRFEYLEKVKRRLAKYGT